MGNVLCVHEDAIPAGMTIDDFAQYLRAHPKEEKRFKIKSPRKYNKHEFVAKFWLMVYEIVSFYMSCRKKIRQQRYVRLQFL